MAEITQQYQRATAQLHQTQERGPSLATAEPGCSTRPLPMLRTAHYVVLGRYNGKKTRPLTPATRIYRAVRKGIRRTKNLSDREIQDIKKEVTRVLREDKGQHLPDVVFCVDIQRAKAGYPNLEFLSCLDYDGEEVFLVKDVDDEFLRKDVDSKRHGEKAISKVIKRDAAKKRSPRKMDSIASTCSTLTTAASTLGSDSTPHSSVSFQLKLRSDLQNQIEKTCVEWIGEGPGVEAVKRKTELVETFKEFFQYYSAVLAQNNPLASSKVPELQNMNESLLVQFANQLGNSMIDWYTKHPGSCLKGEENCWADGQRVSPTAAVESEMTMEDSVGSRDSWRFTPSDEDIMKAAFSLSECSIGSGDRKIGSRKEGSSRRGSVISTPFDDASFHLGDDEDSFGHGRMSVAEVASTEEVNFGSHSGSEDFLDLDLGLNEEEQAGPTARRSLKIWNRSKGWHRLDS